MRGGFVSALLALGIAAACSSNAPTSVGTPTPASPTTSVSASPSPISPLVGQWELNRTCAAIVKALTDADLKDLIPQDVGELIKGVPENGPLPATWDPSHPCANAKPPTEHSHTFWDGGTFNSYDENGNQVDEDSYRIINDNTVQIDDVTFHYSITNGDTLMLSPLPTKAQIREALAHPKEFSPAAWAFSVAYPGQTWTRVTSGPYVPPGTGSPG